MRKSSQYLWITFSVSEKHRVIFILCKEKLACKGVVQLAKASWESNYEENSRVFDSGFCVCFILPIRELKKKKYAFKLNLLCQGEFY